MSLAKLFSRNPPGSFLLVPSRYRLAADKPVPNSAASPVNRSSVHHRAETTRPTARDPHKQLGGSKNRCWRHGPSLRCICSALRLVEREIPIREA